MCSEIVATVWNVTEQHAYATTASWTWRRASEAISSTVRTLSAMKASADSSVRQGSVGIDRDYDSLRQDLWIATDQAFKEAMETYSRKQAYLSSLARQSDIDDFSKAHAHPER